MKKKKYVNKHEYSSFLKNALALRGSVTPRVINKVFFMVGYSIIISCLKCLIPSISLPVGPFEYAGLVMGLILVFRVNSGYSRWWEARKLWGNIVNQSRNLCIIVISYSKSKDPNWTQKLTNYVAALPYLMKNNLRGSSSIKEIKHLLDEHLLLLIEEAEHKPVVLSSFIANELALVHANHEMDSFAFLQAEKKRELILNCQGACERILKTPIPFVMAIKARRFIFLFLLVLPFALSHVSVYISPIITGLVSYALFSLDQIGVELQNPFSEDRLSHLPLDVICATIEKNIKELQAKH